MIKFDIKFGLKVLGQNEQEIRMTGEVVEPNLSIPENEFNFGGVPILMKATKQFHIENKVRYVNHSASSVMTAVDKIYF